MDMRWVILLKIFTMNIYRKKRKLELKKKKTKKNRFIFTADLQAVLMAPRSNVSSNYYKTKLLVCVHNWCIYDMKTGDGYYFLWNEAEGGLNSEEFSTILSKFISKEVVTKMDEYDREITFYTDGCTYQNRNTTLSNAMINVAIFYNVDTRKWRWIACTL